MWGVGAAGAADWAGLREAAALGPIGRNPNSWSKRVRCLVCLDCHVCAAVYGVLVLSTASACLPLAAVSQGEVFLLVMAIAGTCWDLALLGARKGRDKA